MSALDDANAAPRFQPQWRALCLRCGHDASHWRDGRCHFFTTEIRCGSAPICGCRCGYGDVGDDIKSPSHYFAGTPYEVRTCKRCGSVCESFGCRCPQWCLDRVGRVATEQVAQTPLESAEKPAERFSPPDASQRPPDGENAAEATGARSGAIPKSRELGDGEAKRCPKCGHAARYFDVGNGFCAIVLPDGGDAVSDGITRWYCGCRCEGASTTPILTAGEDAAHWRQRAERAEAELARLRGAVRGLCAILHADSPHDPSGEVEP